MAGQTQPSTYASQWATLYGAKKASGTVQSSAWINALRPILGEVFEAPQVISISNVQPNYRTVVTNQRDPETGDTWNVYTSLVSGGPYDGMLADEQYQFPGDPVPRLTPPHTIAAFTWNIRKRTHTPMSSDEIATLRSVMRTALRGIASGDMVIPTASAYGTRPAGYRGTPTIKALPPEPVAIPAPAPIVPAPAPVLPPIVPPPEEKPPIIVAKSPTIPWWVYGGAGLLLLSAFASSKKR